MQRLFSLAWRMSFQRWSWSKTANKHHNQQAMRTMQLYVHLSPCPALNTATLYFLYPSPRGSCTETVLGGRVSILLACLVPSYDLMQTMFLMFPYWMEQGKYALLYTDCVCDGYSIMLSCDSNSHRDPCTVPNLVKTTSAFSYLCDCTCTVTATGFVV